MYQQFLTTTKCKSAERPNEKENILFSVALPPILDAWYSWFSQKFTHHVAYTGQPCTHSLLRVNINPEKSIDKFTHFRAAHTVPQFPKLSNYTCWGKLHVVGKYMVHIILTNKNNYFNYPPDGKMGKFKMHIEVQEVTESWCCHQKVPVIYCHLLKSGADGPWNKSSSNDVNTKADSSFIFC